MRTGTSPAQVSIRPGHWLGRRPRRRNRSQVGEAEAAPAATGLRPVDQMLRTCMTTAGR